MTNIIFSYHDATKHHFRAFARSLGFLDWATQPDPFLRYPGAELIPLVHPPMTADPGYEAPFTEGALPAQPVTRETVSRLFYDALAISAWKEAGTSRWALRINPSSGNLHPTEGYFISGPVPGIHATPAVFHYAPREHGLELRTEFSPDLYAELTAGFPAGTFFLGLTSIHWREAWKYGERAYRYCQHDAGHAVAALVLAASALGWKTVLLDAVGDDPICRLLRLGRMEDPEAEHPDCLLAVFPVSGTASSPPGGLPGTVIEAISQGTWHGHPNVLSSDHHPWPIIDQVAGAAWKPETPVAYPPQRITGPGPLIAAPPDAPPLSFRKIVHQRRSAVDFDGKTGVSRETFYRILGKVIPGDRRVPFTALPWPASIHLGLFVHRVQGIPPGLYFLVRNPEKTREIRDLLHPSFVWTQPAGCPRDLPLYLLEEGDCRQLAVRLSCQQDIGGNSAFSLGMIAEFEAPIQAYGPWFYRRLFWESGVVGQVLYLEAEAAGIRGTGIGCFFDDPVHEVLGLKDHRYQSLYHFTIGGPVEDTRIMTLPPYPV